jgi:hypothetical protein
MHFDLGLMSEARSDPRRFQTAPYSSEEMASIITLLAKEQIGPRKALTLAFKIGMTRLVSIGIQIFSNKHATGMSRADAILLRLMMAMFLSPLSTPPT